MSNLLTLSGNRTNLIFRTDSGMPELVHWGKQIKDLTGIEAMLDKPVPQAGLDQMIPLTLAAESGRGLFCAAGIQGHRQGLDWSPIFTIVDVLESEQAIEFVCEDARAGLKLNIEVSVDPKTEIYTWQAHVTNTKSEGYQLDHLAITLPIAGHLDQLRSFGGRWCQEFREHSSLLEHGAIRIESRHGRTSHQKSPFWFVGDRTVNNNQGEVFGFHLAWSGNHSLNFEVTSDGRHLLQIGELLFPGEITLEQGETYSTPKLYAGYSPSGMNQVSQSFHQHIRHNILKWPVEKPRPVILNTWEGIYFDHDPEYIMQMARKSAELGVERFVLDDGWFEGRDNEYTALGDWYLDKKKYPNGLEPLIDTVKDAGMEFGIWLEPEMINPDSNLYRKHPDWVMKVEGYEPPLGRYQHVLNLQIPEAFDYIFERIDELLTRYDIDYVKWDMNRQLVQAAHQNKPGFSGQNYAFYRLIEKVRNAHPSVEIESCASGGGRVDMGVMEYTHRFWTSDCNDALERVSIQNGFSYFFPPEVMGAHIGADEAHTTQRKHKTMFRALVALFGHMGLELDPVKSTEQELSEIKEFVALHKTLRPLIHDTSSRFYRLDITTDDCLVGWMIQSGDKQDCVIAFFQTAMPRFAVPTRVTLPQLDSSQNYQVEVLLKEQEIGYAMKHEPEWMQQPETVSGDWLTTQGLQLPIMYPETGLLLRLSSAKS